MAISDPPILVRVVHMGDSITFGQYVDEGLRWTSIISDRLTKKYLDSSINILSLSRGISGETTRMGLERFPADVQSLYPDVLTIQFGLNDCNCWLTDRGAQRVSSLAFKANLIEMIERSRLFGTKHIILANNHPTLRYKVMLNGERFEDANARYSEIIHQVAIDAKVTFCDIRKEFEKYGRDELAEYLLPYPDQLHLSVAGNQVYANVIRPLVDEYVQEVILQKQGAINHEKQY
jgi:lysophospholipase L1-like esterase